MALVQQTPGGVREIIPAAALKSFTVDPNDIDNNEFSASWEIATSFVVPNEGLASRLAMG